MSAAAVWGDYRNFLKSFREAKGATNILIVSTLYSFSFGCVIGVVPSTLADRYAYLNHGFTGRCNDYELKPDPCIAGSQDAQNAAAWANVALSLLTLLCNPVMGAVSDMHGRRPVILLALIVSCLPSTVFWLLQRLPHLHPVWYYTANSVTGLVSYLSVAFATLSDVIGENYRAPAYGLLLSGFYGGFAFAPSIPWIVHNENVVGTISLMLLVSALFLAIASIPETMPQDSTESTLVVQQESEVRCRTRFDWLVNTMSRPLREILILNRCWSLRLLTIGSFFAAMVFASDSTLVIYYIQEELNVHTRDLAAMCLFLGFAGVLIQGCLLHPLVSFLGEPRLLFIAFICGALHNFMYGAARKKLMIYVALVFSQLTKINVPLLSSLASRTVEVHEQGRVQGALMATNAIANAVGPMSMELVQHYTAKEWGKGFMFTYASGLYILGSIIMLLIPDKARTDGPVIVSEMEANDAENRAEANTEANIDLTEPLLVSNENNNMTR